MWLCVLGLGFRLRPAIPGCGVWVCGCLCARSVGTPPILAGVRGVVVCTWALSSAAPCHSCLGYCSVCVGMHPLPVPRHSWLGCWGVCVFVCALHQYPVIPGWGVRCGGVCLGPGFGCAPPVLAGMLGCVCPCAPSARTPPLLALVLGCLCVCVCAPPVPRHSLLGCTGWVCVHGLGFQLRPANCGLGFAVCVCLCVRSACTPPTLAAVCVCVSIWVSAAPCHTWLECWGVCVGLHPPPVPRLWFVGWMLPGTYPRRRSLPVVRAARVSEAPGGRWCLTPVPVPLFWPPACLSCVPCVPASVPRASSGPVALGAAVRCPDAVVLFATRGACAPAFTGWLRGARKNWPRTGLFVPAAGRCRRRGAGLAPRRTRSGLPDGVVPGRSLRRPSWAACAAVVCVCGPSHLRVPFPVPSVLRLGTLLVHRGFLVWMLTPPSSGRMMPRPGPVRVWVCVPLLAWLGWQASCADFGAPHLFLWPVLVLSLSARPRPGWGCPACGFCCGFSFSFCALPLSLAVCVFRPGVPWSLASCGPPPFFPFFSLPPSPVHVVFSLFLFFSCLPSVFFFRTPPFFFPAMVCRLCRAGLICVSWAVGCVGVCCCGRCAPAGAGLRLRCVVWSLLVVPVLCVVLPVVLRVSGGAVLAEFLFPFLPLVPSLCALSSGPVLRRL